jgi:hypothetical protein
MSGASMNSGPNNGGGDSSLSMNAGASQVRMAELDFSGAAVVQGVGFRILIPVPDLGSENTDLTVQNYKGELESIRGYGFLNAVDASQQAVVGDGTGMLIVALNPEKVEVNKTAELVLNKVNELGGAEALTVKKLDQLMHFITSELELKDVYNSTDSGVLSMVAVGEASQSARPLGLHKSARKLALSPYTCLVAARFLMALTLAAPTTPMDLSRSVSLLRRREGSRRTVR